MFNGEADDIGDVGACQDTVTNPNVDREDAVLKSFCLSTNYPASFYQHNVDVICENCTG